MAWQAFGPLKKCFRHGMSVNEKARNGQVYQYRAIRARSAQVTMTRLGCDQLFDPARGDPSG